MSQTPDKAVPSEVEASDKDGFPDTLPDIEYGDETPAGGEPKDVNK